jgi:hypothetical protein
MFNTFNRSWKWTLIFFSKMSTKLNIVLYTETEGICHFIGGFGWNSINFKSYKLCPWRQTPNLCSSTPLSQKQSRRGTGLCECSTNSQRQWKRDAGSTPSVSFCWSPKNSDSPRRHAFQTTMNKGRREYVPSPLSLYLW